MFMHWRTGKLEMKRWNKYSKNLLAVAGTSILIMSGCSFLPKEEQVLAPPLAEPTKIEYDTAEAKVGDIVKRVTGNGNLIPTARNDLYYEHSGGRISKINVKQGDKVKKGQVLVELETGNIAYEIEHAKIDLQKAKLRLEQLKVQEADSYSLKLAELDVKSVELRLRQMNGQLSKARITAPITGYITFVADKNSGDNVDAYEPIIQVADPAKLQIIYTAISASDLSDVKTGMKANIEVAGKKVKGEVVQTPNDVPTELLNRNPDLYQKSIIISLKDAPKDAEIGDSASLEIITDSKKGALVIPKSALRSSFGREYVQVLEDDTKKEVDIEKGIVAATEVEVLKGLEAGELVILK
jgi:macrolide-specific efflux system membrane fusion protein